MGESAEKMAKGKWYIRVLIKTHSRTAATRLRLRPGLTGGLREEVMPIFVPPQYEAFSEDNLRAQRLRSSTPYAKLAPVFDAPLRHGHGGQ